MSTRPFIQDKYRRPLSLGWLRLIVALGPALTLALVVGLILICQVKFLREGATGIIAGTDYPTAVELVGIGTCLAVFLTAVLGLATTLRWLKWKVLGVAWVLAGLTLAWLAWDERTVRHPRTVADLVPVAADADKSYAVLMRYSRDHPSPEARAFNAPSYMKYQMPAALAREAGPWREFLQKNRAALEADWKTLAPQRAWLDELNGFPQISDLGEAGYRADTVNYSVLRVLSYRYSMAASLCAVAGRGDEAVAILTVLVETSRKLRSGSHTLVRTMIAIIMEKMAYDTANFVIDGSPPSEAARARLSAALADDPAGRGPGNLLRIEAAAFLPVERSITLGARLMLFDDVFGVHSQPLPALLDRLDPVLFNRVATANLYGDSVDRLAALADARELAQYAAAATEVQSALWRTPSPKNVAGRMMLDSPTPRFEKILSIWWETEDKRQALRRRLEAKK